MKRLLCGVLAAGLALSFSACSGGQDSSSNASTGGSGTQPLEKITVVLDWTPNTNHTGLYVAEDQGYFKEAGLEVEILSAPEDGAVPLVASGKAQFGVSFQEELAFALTADEPLAVTAVAAIIEHNTSGILSLKDKGIDSFRAMEGKSYATWDSPFEQAVLKEVLSNQGASFDKLELMHSTVIDAVSAIQSNVDSVWVYEAWDVVAAKLAGLDCNFIKFSDESAVLDFYTPILVGNDAFLKENPEVARAFMQAVAKGYEYAIEKPDEAADILIKAVPDLSADMVRESQKFLASAYKAEKASWGVIDEARWTAFYDWMYEKGLIPSELGNRGFTNEFLSAAA
ncbi:MAG: ABC transporter substrate-binding protein [Clostridiales bacterium]|nr:ABC transporter substrate-binding protein [Clostridiales bacterium]